MGLKQSGQDFQCCAVTKWDSLGSPDHIPGVCEVSKAQSRRLLQGSCSVGRWSAEGSHARQESGWNTLLDGRRCRMGNHVYSE